VSGLNVAMLAALVGFLLKPLGTGPIIRVLLTLPVLGAYALITGGGPSCVRATLMGVLLLGGTLLARPTVLPNHLAAAACLILAWDTNQIFLPGFQFSFVLVIALMTGVPWLQRRIEPVALPDAFLPRTLWNRPQRVWVRVWHTVAAALSVTAIAWLASLLLMAGYFHLVAPGALLANLLAVPLAFAILALGLGSVSTGFFAPGISLLLNETNALITRVLVAALEVCARIPGSHFYVEHPRLRPDCEIQVLDVGPGAATHVRVAGRDWLVDCGSASLYASVVRPTLRSRGVNRLDGLILTHGDTAHVGGAGSAVADFLPRQIFESGVADRSRIRRGFHRQLAAAGRGKALCVRGDTLPVAPGVYWEVLYPPAGLTRPAADDKALVLRLTAHGFRVLWTSDSGFSTESWLIENEPDLSAAILIKGLHERDFSGTPEFLARVRPEVIITAALGWRQTPPEDGLSQQGAVLFRQERSGAVQVQSRGDDWTVAGFLDAQIFRSRAR
jgi:ComEC/Rec2-related protein